MFTKKTVTSTNSSQLEPEASKMARTLSKTLRHCASKSNSRKLPFLSNFNPGTAESVASEPATRGPTPERKSNSPTRRACGYEPTGLGALSVDIRDVSDINLFFANIQEIQDIFGTILGTMEIHKFVPMRKGFLFIVVSLLTLLTGCIEIIDDLTLNLDGSGTLKYNLNLSSSKVKINSLLALDSLDGKKVPSIPEIKSKVLRIERMLNEQEGITAAQIEADYNNFVFKLSCDFNSLEELQSAMKTVVIAENKNKPIPGLEYNWLTYNDTTLQRSVPEVTIKKSREIKDGDRNLLKNGSYTSITRFESEVERFDNENARLSANKKAVMIRTDPYSLTQNPHLLDNIIYLKSSED